MKASLPVRQVAHLPAKRAAPRPAVKRKAATAPATPVAAKRPRSPAPVAIKPAVHAETPKIHKDKAKLVRDSFTMPQADVDLIALLKERALGFKRPAKKSELLRAGLHALQALDDKALHASLGALVSLKPGRPKKSA